ncbi:type VI secretion system baseplate subunit TssG [Trinickia dabaoshanensis]|uniref:Type VI secretion system baseplate subunit TssG n=1 Tax=Trinickia dabaoshanensis TaxID=564714 RepID=A0A2N7W115_9BURK|nr:type VI secretion system baseplate subunit TssG [Trinickia dabaoshanensis]PMS23109.1 type VI secretion system baseplate subunit TssG [Trinickia dabaoshanensis]
MQTAQRGIDAGVVERLLDEPYRFQFFQAVRVLETWFSKREAHVSGENARTGVAFRNSLALTFPPSEIEHAVPYDEAGEPLAGRDAVRAALAQSKLERIELTPSFFGLLGGQGALPLHYTEQLIGRAQVQRDHAAREFFDVFSNRATALFYAAWKKYRLPFHYELDRDERYLPLLLALAGTPDAATRAHLQEGRGALIDEAIAGYALPARHRPMSAAYLARTLTDYFRAPVQVEQFAGKWYAVPAPRLTVLGRENATLGATALAGERVWQRDMRVRIVVGPLNKRDYEAFLPGEGRAIALERMLMLLAGITIEYEVSLVLAREEVGMSRLGKGARLGYDAFLCTRPAERDRDDARYELNVIH